MSIPNYVSLSETTILTDEERKTLRVALLRNCTCDQDASICPGHASANDQKWLKQLVYARRLRERLCVEEWSHGKPVPARSVA